MTRLVRRDHDLVEDPGRQWAVLRKGVWQGPLLHGMGDPDVVATSYWLGATIQVLLHE